MEEKNVNETVEKGLTFSDLLFILKRNFFSIVLVTVIAAIIGAMIAVFAIDTNYTARSRLIFDVDRYQSGGDAYDDRNAVQFGKELLPTLVDFISLDAVGQRMKEYGDANSDLYDTKVVTNFRSGVTSSYNEDSLLFSISFTTTEGEDEAVQTVNAIVNSFIAELNTQEGEDPKYAMFVNKIKVADPATYASTSSSRAVCVIASILLGFILVYGFFIIRHLMDDTIKSKSVLESVTGFNAIAFIEDIRPGD